MPRSGSSDRAPTQPPSPPCANGASVTTLISFPVLPPCVRHGSNVSHNYLTGNLPASMFALSKLTKLAFFFWQQFGITPLPFLLPSPLSEFGEDILPDTSLFPASFSPLHSLPLPSSCPSPPPLPPLLPSSPPPTTLSTLSDLFSSPFPLIRIVQATTISATSHPPSTSLPTTVTPLTCTTLSRHLSSTPFTNIPSSFPSALSVLSSPFSLSYLTSLRSIALSSASAFLRGAISGGHCGDCRGGCFRSASGSKGPSGPAQAAGPAVCRQYQLEVLAAATGMWAEANKIGSGGFGDVYRAEDPADPSTLWAVKRAKVNEMASKHHPHLVRLLGFCIDVNKATEQTEQILIYEFMPNGDLERWLGPGMGDVHSFGVVMLTILTARKAIYNSEDNQINLKQWVAPFIAANDGVTFKDPSLEAPPDIILRLARLALSCTAMPTVLRPNMIKVLAELEALREEVCGATRNQMARRIDREIEDKQGHNLEEELANAIRIGSSGDDGESRKRSE
ncbi:unnamed protein product [Closterium sp. Naga37s-1]|nr:unnamed protein product [Closterium sp. Naga37s-1]